MAEKKEIGPEKNAPGEDVEALYKNQSSNWDVQLACVSHKNVPATVLEAAVQHKDWRVRAAAVRHKAATPEQLQRWGDSSDHDLRWLVQGRKIDEANGKL
jgi:hypothetical protein